MPITSLDEYKSLIEESFGLPYSIAGMYSGYSAYQDMVIATVPPGIVIPTTAVTCSKSTVGALNSELESHSSSDLFIVNVSGSFSEYLASSIYLIDRLSHQSGLVGNITTPQTTNLPTAALTRYTNGSGVIAGIVVYNSTLTMTLSLSYTNELGTSGRTTPATPMTVSPGGIKFMPLQNGDEGIRSIESVTISSIASTAGNFGVVLFKPLLLYGKPTLYGCNLDQDFISGNMLGGIPQLLNDACLWAICVEGDPGLSTTSGSSHGYINIGAI